MRGFGLALAVAAISAACGGTSSTGSTGGSATFSGALTGTAPVSVSASKGADGLLSLTLQSTSSTGPHVMGQLNIQNGGALQTTTYTGGSSTKTATITAYQPPAGSANFQAAATGGANDQGTFSITFTSTGTTVTSGSFSSWPASHGSFAATMPAVPSSAGGTATGTVTLTGTF